MSIYYDIWGRHAHGLVISGIDSDFYELWTKPLERILTAGHYLLSDAKSMTKRYLTSRFSILLSYASLIFCIGITSTSATMLRLAQKSIISFVSLIPPTKEPATLLRWKAIELSYNPGSNGSIAPRITSVPSRFRRST
jgi:hypothetical protein